jgi:hypothetical protein
MPASYSPLTAGKHLNKETELNCYPVILQTYGDLELLKLVLPFVHVQLSLIFSLIRGSQM